LLVAELKNTGLVVRYVPPSSGEEMPAVGPRLRMVMEMEVDSLWPWSSSTQRVMTCSPRGNCCSSTGLLPRGPDRAETQKYVMGSSRSYDPEPFSSMTWSE
jgi:hypothetical protein